MDYTSDDTFTEEVTIPVRPRHRSPRLAADAEWPPPSPSAKADVLKLDRPPLIARPWVPVRHRALDPDAIVLRRQRWSTWLPIAVIVAGTALIVALTASILLGP